MKKGQGTLTSIAILLTIAITATIILNQWLIPQQETQEESDCNQEWTQEYQKGRNGSKEFLENHTQTCKITQEPKGKQAKEVSK